jgi:hypothetical protein
MRCSVSPTISTAPDKLLAARCAEALLFAQVLAPLAAGLGPVGELTLTAVAQRLFVARR